MQGIRAFNGKRTVIFIVIPLVLLVLLVVFDQITKYFAESAEVRTTVIDGFFYLSYSVNKGAGFSFLADKEWGQTLFKIITPIAIVLFFAFYLFALKKSYKWLAYSLVLVIAGTIGNFIDRLFNGQVVDFLSFKFGSYYFPTFNIADICLTVGVIMLIVHFLFIDDAALFKKKQKPDERVENQDENL